MEMLRSAATSSSRPGSVYTLDMASSSITGGPSSLPAAPQIARKFTRPWCAPSASRFDSHVKSEDVMGGPRAGLESGTWAGSDSSTISSPAVRSTSTISISRCIVGQGRGRPSPSLLSSLLLLPQSSLEDARIKKASKSRDRCRRTDRSRRKRRRCRCVGGGAHMDDIPARQSLLAAASSTWRWLDQRPRGHLFQPRVRSPAMRARGVTPLRLCRVDAAR